MTSSATLPDVLTFDGRRFLRARWAKPYVGVVAQYREDKPRDSGHLFVMDDGRIVVPHADGWNPDAGVVSLVLHGLTDDRTRTLQLAAAGVVGWLLGRRGRAR